MPDVADDLALLISAAEAAGDIALAHAGPRLKVWDKPGSAGPVTAADLEVDAMLHERLRAARPDYGWLSEETADDTARLAAEAIFIVDPIDGTRAFIADGKDWAHSLAVARGGRVTAAVVYMPRRAALFAAAAGAGASRNGETIAVSARGALRDAAVLAARPNFDPRHWTGGQVPPVRRHFRSSLAYRLCLVAEGRFDAMLTLRPSWEWDIAAGALIVAEAGGRATSRAGAPLRFNTPNRQTDGVLAGGPELHGRLASALRR